MRRPRNRRGEGGQLRAEILAAATELLDEGGDERAVTLRAVARRAGIAAPSIYPHFLDQPAIVLAVVEQAFDDLTRRLTAAADPVEDPRQRLCALCRAYLSYARDHPQRYRLMFGGRWHPSVEQILADALISCVTAGQCVSDDPAGDAIALWLGLHGLAHQRAVTSVFPWPTDIIRRIAVPLAHLVS